MSPPRHHAESDGEHRLLRRSSASAADATPEQIKRPTAGWPASCTPTSPRATAPENASRTSPAPTRCSPTPRSARCTTAASTPPRPGGGAGFGAGFGFQDIFETFFGAASGGSAQRGPVPRARRGQDALVRLDLDLAEAAFGAHREVPVDTAVVCPTCQGPAAARAPHRAPARSAAGAACRAARRPFLPRPGDDVQPVRGVPRLRHRDPRPVPRVLRRGPRAQPAHAERSTCRPGSRRARASSCTGQGEVGPAGGPPGDVYLEVREAPARDVHPARVTTCTARSRSR